MEFIRELEPNYEYVSRTSRKRRMNFTIEEESAVLHENSNVSSAIITALLLDFYQLLRFNVSFYNFTIPQS